LKFINTLIDILLLRLKPDQEEGQEDSKLQQIYYLEEYGNPETNTCDYPEPGDPYANINYPAYEPNDCSSNYC